MFFLFLIRGFQSSKFHVNIIWSLLSRTYFFNTWFICAATSCSFNLVIKAPWSTSRSGFLDVLPISYYACISDRLQIANVSLVKLGTKKVYWGMHRHYFLHTNYKDTYKGYFVCFMLQFFWWVNVLRQNKYIESRWFILNTCDELAKF